MSTIFIILSILAVLFLSQQQGGSDTEEFIQRWFTNKNGTLATYIRDTKIEDKDIVKDREALSETLGFWMEYALEKDDKSLFDESVQILIKYFLVEDGFVYWKLTEQGEKEVNANALIDDLRIINSLHQADQKWQNTIYKKTAKNIGEYIIKHNVQDDVLTDFYEKESQLVSNDITLSYIETKSLTLLEEKGILSKPMYTNMVEILEEAPMLNNFFPKKYNIKSKEYVYDKQVNMIDQALVALNRVHLDLSTEEFNTLIKNELMANDAIYGQYDLENGKVIQKYESPAVYGFLLMYYLELEQIEMAEMIYTKMNNLKHKYGKFRGGYSVNNGNSHVFDNVVPLVAEQKFINAKTTD